ncbi:hypothetical protein BGZ93_000953 [Podila epicladia]|nr:hypothetical protein BGZ92_009496 [Podila epicladia]KAG0084914.1 hypothetical protein BGZ93_000953 [Podila epicladia]
MVRLTLSFLSVASAFAVVSAAPYFAQQPFINRFGFDAQCLPDISITEYQKFQLWSRELQSYVSKKMYGDRVVGGVYGDKNLQQLDFCVVLYDSECEPILPANCILEDVDYYLRVSNPIKGYLQVDGHYVKIVDSFEEASPLSLSNDGSGLRISHYDNDGEVNVLATSKFNENGQPVVLEYPQRKRQRQRFDIVEPNEASKRIALSEPSQCISDLSVEALDNQCVPGISIREYHPFSLKSTFLNSIVSKEVDSSLVVGGINGDKDLKQLELCIVSEDAPCSSIIPSECIRQHGDYRFRVEAPLNGYLRIVEGQVEIVRDFEEASALGLFKDEPDWPLRISGRREDGKRVVLAARERGGPITAERPRTDAVHQWFEIIEANYGKEHSLW